MASELPGPRSRLTRRGALGLLAAAGAFAGATFVVRRRAAVATRSPWLRIHEGPLPPIAADPPALWLALATLAPERRELLLDDLDAAMTSAEARANPLLVDFLDDDVLGVFRRNQSWLLPICTAASALLASRYQAPDGFSVSVVAAGAARNAADVVAWKRGAEDGSTRRARFLAWPAARSIVIRSKNAADCSRLANDLRDTALHQESALALLLDAGVLRSESPDVHLERVFARLSKGQAALSGSDDVPLRPILPERGAPISPWMVLGDTELLAVPKLSALSPVARFESELRARLGSDAEVLV